MFNKYANTEYNTKYVDVFDTFPCTRLFLILIILSNNDIFLYGEIVIFQAPPLFCTFRPFSLLISLLVCYWIVTRSRFPEVAWYDFHLESKDSFQGLNLIFCHNNDF